MCIYTYAHIVLKWRRLNCDKDPGAIKEKNNKYDTQN